METILLTIEYGILTLVLGGAVAGIGVGLYTRGSTIPTVLTRMLRHKLDPSTPFYTFSFPNADTILTILPFLLFTILFLTAYFATYLSYQQILFYPESKADKPFSWTNQT
jgi:hypothetical protein